MKNKEKNVVQPHILTKYHEIDVLANFYAKLNRQKGRKSPGNFKVWLFERAKVFSPIVIESCKLIGNIY